MQSNCGLLEIDFILHTLKSHLRNGSVNRVFFVATVVDKQTTDAVCALAMHRVHIERFIDLFA